MEEDRIKDDAVRVTGHDDRAQSVQASGTATEAAILKESTLSRIKMKLWLAERTFITRIGRLRVANIQQFYTIPKVLDITDEKGTPEFSDKINQLGREGRLEEKDGRVYERQYRSIRMSDKNLAIGNDGQIKEVAQRGIHFFEVKPEHLRGQFDIVVGASPTLPISKPLLQSKVSEMYDRVAPLAIQGVGGYDITKLTDKLLEINDFNPDDFKSEQQQAGGGDQEQQIEMAGEENEAMMNGEDIGPTPFAEQGHTMIHIGFMKSEDFKKNVPTGDPRLEIFTKHIMGESMAQEQRGQGQQQAQPPMPGKPGGMGTMKETMPGRVMGGENQQPIAYSQGRGPGK
jgi:hypothetical protein